MVANMRNGVLAINRNGALVLINDEACRIFGLPEGLDYLGQPFADVFRSHHDIVRVLGGAFELASLPNRAELRLKSTAKVIGYTLSLVRDEHDVIVGAALFFKDLTHVEQMVERERLRDRLATLGEMAATMAHEIKNPLGGIEVMAGLLRRQVPDGRPGGQNRPNGNVLAVVEHGHRDRRDQEQGPGPTRQTANQERGGEQQSKTAEQWIDQIEKFQPDVRGPAAAAAGRDQGAGISGVPVAAHVKGRLAAACS